MNSILSFFEALMYACEGIDTRSAHGRKFTLFEVVSLVAVGLMMLHDRFGYRVIRRIFSASFTNVGAKKQLTDVNADEDFRETWQKDMAEAEQKLIEQATRYLELLRTLSPFKHGIPSYSCMSRVMKTIALSKLIADMSVYTFSHLPEGGIRNLILDGKALLGAQNKGRFGYAVYMINVQDAKSGLFLTSFPVGSKKNEVSALSAELENILLGGVYIVSADAMATQRIIISIIDRMGSFYVFPVKGNQKVLMRLLRWCMTQEASKKNPDERLDYYLDLNGCENCDAEGYLIPTRVVIKEEDYSIPVEAYVEDDESDAENAEQVTEILDSEGASGMEMASTVDSANGESVSISFFGNSYDYQDPGLPKIDMATASDKKVIYVQVKNGDDYVWIKMAKVSNRWERREVQLFAGREWLDTHNVSGFDSVKAIGMITRYRLVEQYDKTADDKKAYILSITRTPYITSKVMGVKEFADTVRGEWRVEQAHRDLDVEMGEDKCTISAGNASYAVSALRKMVRNLEVMVASAWAEASETITDVQQQLRNVRQATKGNFERCFNYMRERFVGIDQIF